MATINIKLDNGDEFSAARGDGFCYELIHMILHKVHNVQCSESEHSIIGTQTEPTQQALGDNWRSMIPWDDVPHEYEFIAMDEDGNWSAFTHEPFLDDTRDMWDMSEKYHDGLDLEWENFHPPVQWDATLTERP